MIIGPCSGCGRARVPRHCRSHPWAVRLDAAAVRSNRDLQVRTKDDSPGHHAVLNTFGAVAPTPQVTARLEFRQQRAWRVEELRLDRCRYADGGAAENVAGDRSCGDDRASVDENRLAELTPHYCP